MALSHLLDTSVFCQPIKDVPVELALTRWSELGETGICTSAICVAEMLQGLELRQSEKYWRRYRELLAGRYPVLPFDEAVAKHFGQLASDLRRAGQTKPVIELLIAATAGCHGLVVATLNAKHFTGIPGVRVEDWGRV
ncbi:MAG: type II toxin-antitoxin system VapC family toxin [Lentisphaerae bacterium]|nr:type II toxin-antitoxin system VapC family toxin [Lentisphaerota bacterium]